MIKKRDENVEIKQFLVRAGESGKMSQCVQFCSREMITRAIFCCSYATRQLSARTSQEPSCGARSSSKEREEWRIRCIRQVKVWQSSSAYPTDFLDCRDPILLSAVIQQPLNHFIVQKRHVVHVPRSAKVNHPLHSPPSNGASDTQCSLFQLLSQHINLCDCLAYTIGQTLLDSRTASFGLCPFVEVITCSGLSRSCDPK
jgi:hypothetical protein